MAIYGQFGRREAVGNAANCEMFEGAGVRGKSVVGMTESGELGYGVI